MKRHTNYTADLSDRLFLHVIKTNVKNNHLPPSDIAFKLEKFSNQAQRAVTDDFTITAPRNDSSAMPRHVLGAI